MRILVHLRLKKVLRKAIALTALTGFAAVGFAAAGASPAMAGGNGQQVYFYDPASSHVQVCGNNQNGTHVCTPWFAVYATPTTFTLDGYWWVGRVWLYGYSKSASNSSCVVPRNEPNSDFWYCGNL